MVKLNGLKTGSLEVCGASYLLSTTNTSTREHITGVQNIRDSMDMLPTWKLQWMYTQSTGYRSHQSRSEVLGYIFSDGYMRRQDDKLQVLRKGDLQETSTKDIEGHVTTSCFKTRRLEESYNWKSKANKKNINLSRPDSQHSDLKKMTPYTAYPDIQGIIYKDDMNRNRLMCTDELHKFSDGTLNHAHTALNDIATGIQMEYLPKRRWTNQDKRRARLMINAIDRKLRDRRLMRSLEKFVGGRPYGEDLRLLQRTI
ncbi:hypothetical protein Tco_0352783 [Tanacetum coccineum]